MKQICLSEDHSLSFSAKLRSSKTTEETPVSQIREDYKTSISHRDQTRNLYSPRCPIPLISPKPTVWSLSLITLTPPYPVGQQPRYLSQSSLTFCGKPLGSWSLGPLERTAHFCGLLSTNEIVGKAIPCRSCSLASRVRVGKAARLTIFRVDEMRMMMDAGLSGSGRESINRGGSAPH